MFGARLQKPTPGSKPPCLRVEHLGAGSRDQAIAIGEATDDQDAPIGEADSGVRGPPLGERGTRAPRVGAWLPEELR